MLLLVAAEKPAILIAVKYAYLAMLFSTPFIGASMLFSLLYIFFVRPQESIALAPLPPYPPVNERDRLFLVIGELHHPKRPEPIEQPKWLMIPDRGLYTGIAIFGAIGSGKTSCCIYPFAERSSGIELAIQTAAPRASSLKSRVTSVTRYERSSNGMAGSRTTSRSASTAHTGTIRCTTTWKPMPLLTASPAY
jgi:hypothetical protein